MRLRYRFSALLSALLLAAILCVPVSAHAVPDLSWDGASSITVTMRRSDGTLIPGGSLTLYRVGEVCEQDGDYTFQPTGSFASCGESFENLQSPELSARLAEYARSITGTTKKIDENTATVTFDKLPFGLYLLVQNQAASGYYAVSPFLVSVPYLDNDSYIYQVDASPKVTPSPKPGDTKPPTQTETPSAPTTPTSPTTPTTPGKPNLPYTGQLNWPIPVLVVLGLVLFSAGWLLRFGKKKDSYEK